MTSTNRQNSKTCPACQVPMAIVNVVKDDSKVTGIIHTGVVCKHCGWSREDIRDRHFDEVCLDCSKKIGPRRTISQGDLPKLVCSDCSAKHLGTNNPRPVKVRFDIRCPGCDNLQAHYDEWEGHFPGKGSPIPTLFCPSPKCQMKFSKPKPPPDFDVGEMHKAIGNVLADLSEKKVSPAQAAQSVVQILINPHK